MVNGPEFGTAKKTYLMQMSDLENHGRYEEAAILAEDCADYRRACQNYLDAGLENKARRIMMGLMSEKEREWAAKYAMSDETLRRDEEYEGFEDIQMTNTLEE